MNRHIITHEERARGNRIRTDGERMRLAAEFELLNRMMAEAAMPEWYPEGGFDVR